MNTVSGASSSIGAEHMTIVNPVSFLNAIFPQHHNTKE
jgi:hypothetical protein